MSKNKLDRFNDLAEWEHILELTDYQDDQSDKPKGRWKAEVFGNDNPITLELACGKGDYTLALARQNPDRNYVGIDIKGARIWKGAKRTKAESLSNVRFLRIYIDHLDEYFAPEEVDDIWITFPDPYLKRSNRNKRLTSPKFLEIYQSVLVPEGSIKLKTDSDELFSYTRKILKDQGCSILGVVEDIYEECPGDELLTIKTDYENRHLRKGKSISFLNFSLPTGVISV